MPFDDQTRALGVFRGRRQRRPTAVIVVVSPAYPGWSPNRVWLPAPAEITMMKPAAIVERRPAPRVVGCPVPACVHVGPMAGVKVRLPIRIAGGNGREPAFAIAINLRPPAI